MIYRASAYTEYHDIPERRSTLWTQDWPIITVTSIHEDQTRAYGSGALLVDGTDYIVSKEDGRILRVSGSDPYEWLTGIGVVKIVYSAGYDDADGKKLNVPSRLKRIVLDHAATMWREVERKQQNISSMSDSTGGQTRFAFPKLQDWMKEILDRERRLSGIRTYRR